MKQRRSSILNKMKFGQFSGWRVGKSKGEVRHCVYLRRSLLQPIAFLLASEVFVETAMKVLRSKRHIRV